MSILAVTMFFLAVSGMNGRAVCEKINVMNKPLTDMSQIDKFDEIDSRYC